MFFLLAALPDVMRKSSTTFTQETSGANSYGQTVDNHTRTIRANTVCCPRQGRDFQRERIADLPATAR